jgi:hypothetical protein
MNEFLHALALRESGNNYQAINPNGYLGKYQFGPQALQDLGYVVSTPNNVFGKYQFTGKDSIWSPHDLLFSPATQEKIVSEWITLLWNRITSLGLDRFVGQLYAGIEITPSGLIAAAHLGGVGGLKRFLEQGVNPSDNLGTSISSYLATFSGIPITLPQHHPPNKEVPHDVAQENSAAGGLMSRIIETIRGL